MQPSILECFPYSGVWSQWMNHTPLDNRLIRLAEACHFRLRRALDPDRQKAFAGFRSSLQEPLSEPPAAPKEFVRRLGEIYLAQLQTKVQPIYRYGKIWKAFREGRSAYRVAAEAGDVRELGELLRKFHRNEGCTGFAPTPALLDLLRRDTRLQERWVGLLIRKYEVLHQRADPYLAPWLEESPVGAPLVVPYRRRLLSWSTIRHGCYVQRMTRILSQSISNPTVIVELGCGFGNLARLWKLRHPSSTYVLVDLPEVLLIAAFFLRLNFPTARFGLMDDWPKEPSRATIQNYDFWLLPNWGIEWLPDQVADLTVNTASLAEMDQDIVSHYLKQIRRTLVRQGYFYTCNRLVGRNYGQGAWETGMSKWNLDPVDWRLCWQYPSWADRWIEDAGYHEWLLQREA